MIYAADCSISVARQIETKGFEAAVSGNFFVINKHKVTAGLR